MPLFFIEVQPQPVHISYMYPSVYVSIQQAIYPPVDQISMQPMQPNVHLQTHTPPLHPTSHLSMITTKQNIQPTKYPASLMLIHAHPRPSIHSSMPPYICLTNYSSTYVSVQSSSNKTLYQSFTLSKPQEAVQLQPNKTSFK